VATDGILVRVLGDYGPFSAMGKSIGYQVSIGDGSFLVDCGSPLFQQIGGHGLKVIKGLIITHCHDDHKRWFTDLSLFSMYSPDIPHKLPVYTSENINEGLLVSSGPALNSSLSSDSRMVIDHNYRDYVDFRPLAPRAKFRIVRQDTGAGCSHLVVVDAHGETLGPERAKVVISTVNGVLRLLFKDPHYDEWVEPEQFYPFSSTTFYEEHRNTYHDPSGYTIEAINAPVWHGLSSIGIRFSTATESLVFSGDTCHDTELWQRLHSEKRPQKLSGSPEEFAAAAVIYGTINDYIERIWSHERYQEAIKAFDGAVVIHDIAARNSVVHTDYGRLEHTVLHKERTILTHSPDTMTSAWALSNAGKSFLIHNGTFCEMVGSERFPMDAAVYHKQGGKYFVGFHNPDGDTTIYEHDGSLNLGGKWDREKSRELFKVDLYEDVGGRYLPKLADGDASTYMLRADGTVELVTSSSDGSRGVIVESLRGRLANRGSETLKKTAIRQGGE
jgi:ribonuclease BN (tRNA processing enzyme)